MALHVEDSPLGTSSGSSTESFGVGYSDIDSCSGTDYHEGGSAPPVFVQESLPAEAGGLDSRRRFYSIVEVSEADVFLVFIWQ